MRILFFLILLFSHLGYAQITDKACLETTQQFITSIEDNNLKMRIQ